MDDISTLLTQTQERYLGERHDLDAKYEEDSQGLTEAFGRDTRELATKYMDDKRDVRIRELTALREVVVSTYDTSAQQVEGIIVEDDATKEARVTLRNRDDLKERLGDLYEDLPAASKIEAESEWRRAEEYLDAVGVDYKSDEPDTIDFYVTVATAENEAEITMPVIPGDKEDGSLAYQIVEALTTVGGIFIEQGVMPQLDDSGEYLVLKLDGAVEQDQLYTAIEDTLRSIEGSDRLNVELVKLNYDFADIVDVESVVTVPSMLNGTAHTETLDSVRVMLGYDTLKDLAYGHEEEFTKAGVNPQTVLNIATGETGNPRFNTVMSIENVIQALFEDH